MMNAKEVWQDQEDRKEKRMRAMRPVLSQLYGQIRKQATHNPNAPYIVFEIPMYVFGYPLFQISEAREYIMNTLSQGGYMVWVIDDKYLLISWLKTAGGKLSQHRPPVSINYRPNTYDPSLLESMRR